MTRHLWQPDPVFPPGSGGNGVFANSVFVMTLWDVTSANRDEVWK